MNKDSQNRIQQNSPPVEGGVAPLRRRGGCKTSPTNKDKLNVNNLLKLKTFRKNLRKNLTPAEATFWKIVQNKNFEGKKFRRQHSVGNYIFVFKF
jgi:hypothetical protein